MTWRRYWAFTVDVGNPRRQMPWKTYNQRIAACLADRSILTLALDKSRQMLATWEICAYLNWLAEFHGPREILVKGKERGEAAYICERIMTLWGNQPTWLKNEKPATFNRSKVIIHYGTGTNIFGLPEGVRDVRGYQASDFYGDECAFMREFEDVYNSTLAMLSGGIRVILTSTPFLEAAWYRLVFDKPKEIF